MRAADDRQRYTAMAWANDEMLARQRQARTVACALSVVRGRAGLAAQQRARQPAGAALLLVAVLRNVVDVRCGRRSHGNDPPRPHPAHCELRRIWSRAIAQTGIDAADRRPLSVLNSGVGSLAVALREERCVQQSHSNEVATLWHATTMLSIPP